MDYVKEAIRMGCMFEVEEDEFLCISKDYPLGVIGNGTTLEQACECWDRLRLKVDSSEGRRVL